MDDYFSGLIRPHLDQMKLEEEDWKKKDEPADREEPEEPNNNEEVRVSSDSGKDEIDSDQSLPDEKYESEPYSGKKESSSSNSTFPDEIEHAEPPSTLDEFKLPKLNYDRDYPKQVLVGIMGREFDEPWVIASSLQALTKGPSIDGEPTGHPKIKFVPYTIRRSALIRAKFNPTELTNHDVICMSYNASEARIMLTGTDGYYTQLLKHVEALLGSNRGAFIITRYVPPGEDDIITEETNELISPKLKERLHVQESLSVYLKNDQVLSWYDKPQKCHVNKLQLMANTESNPSGYYNNCTLL